MTGELTTIGIGLGAILGSKDLLDKLLGPTADYLGEGLRNQVQKSMENVGRIFNVAYGKLKEDVETPGRVGPRVLKGILDEAWLVEDALAAEYFGGLLATSRSADGNDDNLPYVHLVKQLPSRQLRVHFIIYATVARLAATQPERQMPLRAESGKERFPWELWDLLIRDYELENCILDPHDSDGQVLGLTISGLIDNGLLGPEFGLNLSLDPEDVSIGVLRHPKLGLIVRPTRRGADLFLRALGCSKPNCDLLETVNVDERTTPGVLENIRFPSRPEFIRAPREDPILELQRELRSLSTDLREMGKIRSFQ